MLVEAVNGGKVSDVGGGDDDGSDVNGIGDNDGGSDVGGDNK